MKSGAGRHVIYEQGGWRAHNNKDNDYLIDRAAQKAGITYSGIAGFAMQDSGIQELMGPIVDRTKENLVSTDNGIIMARHRLLRAARALVEKVAALLDDSETYHRAAAAAREHAETFAWPRITARLEEIYTHDLVSAS